MPEKRTLQENRVFARFAWGVLAYNLLVVIWGALVRASGSGAGCGDHWPLCNGEVVPLSADLHRIIEFTHRASNGLDAVLVALLVIWAFRAFPRGHAVRRGAVLAGVFLVTEALLGAYLVLSKHVAQNADPFSSSAHLSNTLTLLAFLALTAWWAGGAPVVRPHGRSAWVAACTVAAVMLLAITGAIAALGDTLFPARSLAAGLAQDFDPASSLLLRLRGLHPLFAAAVAGWLTVYATGRLRTARTAALRLIALVWLQLLVGLVNLALRAPVAMQLVHLLAADLVWIALVLLCASDATGSVQSFQSVRGLPAAGVPPESPLAGTRGR